MKRLVEDSLRFRLLLLFFIAAVLTGIIDFTVSQLIVAREMSNYISHVQRDQVSDWTRLVATVYVDHGSTWNFLKYKSALQMLFPTDGMVLGHTQYALSVHHHIYPSDVHVNHTWLVNPITVHHQVIGTLLVHLSP